MNSSSQSGRGGYPDPPAAKPGSPPGGTSPALSETLAYMRAGSDRRYNFATVVRSSAVIGLAMGATLACAILLLWSHTSNEWMVSAGSGLNAVTLDPSGTWNSVAFGRYPTLTLIAVGLIASWIGTVGLLWWRSLRGWGGLKDEQTWLAGWLSPGTAPSAYIFTPLVGSRVLAPLTVVLPSKAKSIPECLVTMLTGDRQPECIVTTDGRLVFAARRYGYFFKALWRSTPGNTWQGASAANTASSATDDVKTLLAQAKAETQRIARAKREAEHMERIKSMPTGVRIPPVPGHSPKSVVEPSASERSRLIEASLLRLKGLAAFPEETWSILVNNLRAFMLGDPSSPRAILLSGPPGTGKTTIAKAIGQITECKFYARTIADLKMSGIGQSAQVTQALWDEAGKAERSVIFLDECESVFASRNGPESDVMTKEICGVFLPQLDGVKRAGRVLFIGATNLPDVIDQAILSRFDVVITVPAPGIAQRKQILVSSLRAYSLPVTLADRLVPMTEGMSGRDIDGIVKRVRQEVLAGKPAETAIEQIVSTRRTQGNANTKKGLTWDDVAVPDTVRESLQRYVKMLANRERLQALGIDAMPRGVLLFGPPGTGKTQIARVMAATAGCAFHAASTADLKAGFLGQSAHRVKDVFARARTSSPCILFLDELDIIAPSRGSSDDAFTKEIIGQLLQEIDGIKSQSGAIFLLAATNNPAGIDAAILSRFTERFEITLPDEQTRQNIALAILRDQAVDGDREALAAEIARRTDGGSGRDIQNLINQAQQRFAMRALDGGAPPKGLRMLDFPTT